MRKKLLAATHDSQAIMALRTGKCDECFWKLIVALQRKITGAISHFLLENSLRHWQKSGLDHLIPRVRLSQESPGK